MDRTTDRLAAFEQWPESKKRRLLDAAYAEFAEHGYDRASTDAIAKSAGIAKGLLFHYFGSKKNLYVYLLRHASDLLTAKTIEELEKNAADGDDFFAYLRAITLAKQKVAAAYERQARFLLRAYADPPSAVRVETEAVFRAQREQALRSPYGLARLTEKLACDRRLREGVSPETVVRIALDVAEALSARWLKLHRDGAVDLLRDMSPVVRELEEVFDVIRHGVFKSGVEGDAE